MAQRFKELARENNMPSGVSIKHYVENSVCWAEAHYDGRLFIEYDATHIEAADKVYNMIASYIESKHVARSWKWIGIGLLTGTIISVMVTTYFKK